MTVAREPGRDAEQDILDTEHAGPAAIRGGAVRVSGYAVGAVLGLVAAAFMFRALGVDETGQYLTALSIVALTSGLTDAGLATIAVREFSTRDSAESHRFMRNVLGLRLTLAALGVAVAVAFTAVAGYGGVMVAGVAIAGIGVIFQMTQVTLAVPLMARLRFVPVAALDVLRQAVQTVLIIGLALAGAGLLAFLATSIPAALVALIATAVVVAGLTARRPGAEMGEWRRLLRETLPFAIATAVAGIYFRAAIIIVSIVASAAQTGYFGASFRVIEALVVIPQLLVGAAFPIFARAARDDRERLEYALGRSFEVSVVLGCGMAVLLSVGAPVVIAIIAGSDFGPAADVLRIQGVALAATFPAAVGAYALLSLHLHRAVLVVSCVGLVVNVALVALLVPDRGANGAAVGTVAGECVLAAGFLVALLRDGVRPQFPFSLLPRVAAATALAVVPVLVPSLSDAATLVASAALFTVGVVVFRALPEELIVELRRRVATRTDAGGGGR